MGAKYMNKKKCIIKTRILLHYTRNARKKILIFSPLYPSSCSHLKSFYLIYYTVYIADNENSQGNHFRDRKIFFVLLIVCNT